MLQAGDDLPMAFPVAQMIKLSAIATDFLVCPAMFREIMDSDKVWALQKEKVM